MTRDKYIKLGASLTISAVLALPLATAANEPSTTFVDSAALPQHMVRSLLATAEPSDPEALVDIPDAALRRALEEALDKEEDEAITRGDMARLSSLRIERGVDALTGLQHAINLSYLLCANGGVSDLTPLAELKSLTWLYLWSNAIEDIAPLGGLDALTLLYLADNAIFDIAPLAGLEALTGLYLHRNAIDDITPLAGLDALNRLHVGDNVVADVAPLAGLAALTELGLSGNAIADIAPLAGLGALTELYLYSNAIADAAPLAGLDALTVLRLDGNAIADIAPLAGLGALTELGLYDNAVSDIAPLVENEGLGSGDTLDLRRNPLSARSFDTDIPKLQERGVEVMFDAPMARPSDPDALVDVPDPMLRRALEEALSKQEDEPINRGDMARLSRLEIEGGVDQLVGLEHAINLASLTCENGGVSDLTPLAELKSLTVLDISSNAIVDIAPLAGLNALTWLSLWGNAITDITPLAGLNALTSLSLGSNAIVDITPLRGLHALTWLSLWGNAITDITPLAGLNALTSLSLGSNAIVDITPLRGLHALTWLSLSSNAIADIAPLAGLGALTELGLYDNAVSDIAPLVENEGLGSGDTLDLRRNPLSARSFETDIPRLQERGVEVKFDAPMARPSDPEALVDVPDPVLRRALEEALSKQEDEPINRGDMARLSRLEIEGEVAQLVGLEHAINVVYLFCDGGGVSDLTPLAELKSLTRLYLSSNAIADIAPLAGLGGLTHLGLGSNAIVDIAPLAELDALTWLFLGSNEIADIAPLAGLDALTVLLLYSNAIADIGPLAGLAALTSLYLRSNAIADIAPLARLHALTWLDLRYNAISDIAPLVANDGLGSGDTLSLEGNWLSARSIETDIQKLQERGVKVTFDAPEPLAPRDRPAEVPNPAMRTAFERALGKGPGWPIGVKEIGEITELDARDSGIDDLTGLEYATDLEYLDLSGNVVTDISVLEGLESLRVLYLDGNEISNINPLAELPMEILSLRSTKVDDLSGLANMESLYWLALDGNSIRTLPPLPASLEYLYLTNNAISDVGVLAELPNLREVRLSDNSIRSLEPLGGLSELAHIFLNDNRIRFLHPLNFEALVELHLSNNRVRDIEPLGRGQLEMVDVRRNPLAGASANVRARGERDEGTTVLMGRAVPYFPAAGGSNEGFVRVLNMRNEGGDLFIEAVDDSGVRFGPEQVRLGARRAIHFDSGELQNGHAGKGLAGIGPPTAGDWRLEITSALDIEVLSYVRGEDNLVTPMHDIGRDGGASGGLPSFGVFDSADGGGSILRVVNTETGRARWTTGGYDDDGHWRAMANAFVLPGGSALTFTAEQLRDDHGLGEGSRHMRVRGFPWFAQSLYASPTGHLTNLSTVPTNGAEPLANGMYRHRVPLLPAASDPHEGFVRVINRSAEGGEATIEAIDDEGKRFGPARLTLRPRQAVVFSSADLEYGNDATGLAGTVGPGEGDWRLALTSTLDLQVLSYVRSAGGFVSAMHDLAPLATDGAYRIVYFNPASNRRHVSKLRLANGGEQPAAVTITGMDDRGAQSGTVTLAVPAMSAATFTSAQLEAGGEGLAGSLGDGYGKWRLRVESDVPLTVMSLAESRDGHLVNVSTGTAD